MYKQRNEITMTQNSETGLESNIDSISICEAMKGNTSKVIKKLESQIPAHFQIYSDIYSEYLHMVDDLFGSCYIAEKEFFDKLNIDQNSIKMFDEYWGMLAETYIDQIGLSTELLKSYSQVRVSAIKSYDNYMHIFTQSYAKILSQFNSFYENK